MIPIRIELPRSAQLLFNALYPGKDPALLTQDLLAVKLGGGQVIDVSWYPEHDPSGRFCVTIYKRDWRNVLNRIWTEDPLEAAEAVANLARHYSGPTGLVSCSTSTDSKYPHAVVA